MTFFISKFHHCNISNVFNFYKVYTLWLNSTLWKSAASGVLTLLISFSQRIVIYELFSHTYETLFKHFRKATNLNGFIRESKFRGRTLRGDCDIYIARGKFGINEESLQVGRRGLKLVIKVNLYKWHQWKYAHAAWSHIPAGDANSRWEFNIGLCYRNYKIVAKKGRGWKWNKHSALALFRQIGYEIFSLLDFTALQIYNWVSKILWKEMEPYYIAWSWDIVYHVETTDSWIVKTPLCNLRSLRVLHSA